MRRHFTAYTLTPWETKSDRSIVVSSRGCDHTAQFSFISSSHHYKAGKVCQKTNIKSTSMGGTIRPNQPRTVNSKSHWKALNCNIMHDLIIATLQEGRIDSAEGLHSPSSQARREGNAMLLSNSYIKTSARIAVCK